MDKLRLRFSKTGRAIYISHLDLMHTLQRAFSRAGYQLKYSEGFNPHPVMSIALPLSVGTASVCEVLDFRLSEDVNLNEFPQRLTNALPEGIQILEVYEPVRKAADIKYLKITGVFEYDERSTAEMLPLLQEFFHSGPIIMSKKSKNGMTEVDITERISSLDFTPGEDGVINLQAVISAQNPTMNPELIAESLRQKKPEIAPDFARFTRIETFDSAMEVFY